MSERVETTGEAAGGNAGPGNVESGDPTGNAGAGSAEPGISAGNAGAGSGARGSTGASGSNGRGAQGSWRMRRRLGSMVLGFQAPVLLFAAVAGRAIALVSEPERAGLVFGAGLALAALAIVAAVAMRSRSGVWLGWATQVATFAYAVATPMMIAVGVIFTGLWVLALRQGRKADALTDRYLAEHPGA